MLCLQTGHQTPVRSPLRRCDLSRIAGRDLEHLRSASLRTPRALPARV